jgi:galactose oxidase-like protein/Kelch motif protein
MNVARGRHAAVRLADDRVLVVAGNPYNAASGEIYNPATNTWTLTGSLNVPRNYPTAVLLNTGQVLVVGGQNPNTGAALSSAELFNPSTGAWGLTGSLKTGRHYHTASLLSDGTVLVAAGFNPAVSNGLLASAERYSPTTGKWSSAGSLSVARRDAMAAMLQDGRVLVAGGDGYGTFSSAEIFSPATNRWSSAGSMTVAHALATATQLNDGRVLIAGNSYQGDLFSPSTGTSSATGNMVYSDLQETAAVLLGDGRVLVTGGYNNRCDSTGEYCGPNLTNGAEIYSPS